MTMKSYLALALAMALVSGSAQAESAPVELKWSELGAVAIGHDVEFTTKEGVTLRGNVVSVRPEELVLEAKHMSNPKLFPKGGATIPRASVGTLRIVKIKAAWGRRLGTTLGLVAGLTLGGYTAAKTGSHSDAALLTTFLGITGATTVAGYFLGRSADRKVTVIRIVA